MCCKRRESPLVFPEERNLIVKETGKDFFKEMNGYYIIPKDPCPYLENNRCSIQKIKPLHCRIFPIYLKWDGKPRLAITTECPAVPKLGKEWMELAIEEGKKLLSINPKVIKNYLRIYGDAFKARLIE